MTCFDWRKLCSSVCTLRLISFLSLYKALCISLCLIRIVKVVSVLGFVYDNGLA